MSHPPMFLRQARVQQPYRKSEGRLFHRQPAPTLKELATATKLM